MAQLSGLRVAVAGAGVLGLSIAALCARRGADVCVFEPREFADNASGVAAGMLAPVFETILDQASSKTYALLSRGYQAWPAFAEEVITADLHDLTAGALYVGSPEEVSSLTERCAKLGVGACRLGGEAVRRLQPGLRFGVQAALHVLEEGRLAPIAVLQALEATLRERGGRWCREALTLQAREAFDAVVLASGFESHVWAQEVHELACLRPIKGHVLHFEAGPTRGPVVRSGLGYAAPQREGVVFGASMEVGLADAALDPKIVEHLRASASALLPDLSEAPFHARTGVRASTPDGWPLVGRTGSGLYVAAGARRNGWLLAPLVAEAMVEALQGAPPRDMFDPGRFEQAMVSARA